VPRFKSSRNMDFFLLSKKRLVCRRVPDCLSIPGEVKDQTQVVKGNRFGFTSSAEAEVRIVGIGKNTL
jgi:hypothetical protein